jgi:hypothetical protein
VQVVQLGAGEGTAPRAVDYWHARLGVRIPSARAVPAWWQQRLIAAAARSRASRAAGRSGFFSEQVQALAMVALA